MLLSDLPEDFNPMFRTNPHIQQNQIIRLLFQPFEPFRPARHPHHFNRLFRQHPLKGVRNIRLIVDHEDSLHGRGALFRTHSLNGSPDF
jgi:hypothetical protein